MPEAPDYYAEGPEALVVSLAARGDRAAFTELVRRRQPWMRNLMRRLCGDTDLADDLSQRALLIAWRKIRQVREPSLFGAWLKRVAVNEWMQHQRKREVDWQQEFDEDALPGTEPHPCVAIDLDTALSEFPAPVRLCLVLAYNERMTHNEIADATGLKLGTVKTHVRRGGKRLRQRLSAYEDSV